MAPGGTPAWCAMATARAAGAHGGADRGPGLGVGRSPPQGGGDLAQVGRRRARSALSRPPRGRPTWAGPNGRRAPAGRALRRPRASPASAESRLAVRRRAGPASPDPAPTAPSSRTARGCRRRAGRAPGSPGRLAAEVPASVGTAVETPRRTSTAAAAKPAATQCRPRSLHARARPGQRSWPHRPPDHPGAPHPTRPHEDETKRPRRPWRSVTRGRAWPGRCRRPARRADRSAEGG